MAALFVGAYLRYKGLGLLPQKSKWAAGGAVGVLFTLEFFFVAGGLLFTHTSHMITMLYTAPAFAALGLHFFVPEERLGTAQWGGLALAFCGVVVAIFDFSAVLASLDGAMFFGDFLGLLAGISWGATTVVIRLKLSDTPATQTTFIQLIVCFACCCRARR